MTAIHSGSSRQRIVRVSLISLMVIGFAVAYLWDGFRGYPERNRQELIKLLNLDQAAASQLVIDPNLTASEADRRLGIIGRDKLNSVEKLTTAFGKPSLVHGGEAYYLGQAGWLKVRIAAGGGESDAWVRAGKSETDIQLQRWIGIVLSGLGIVLAIHMIRVLRFRVTVDSSSLKITGRQLIPLASISAIDAGEFQKTGRIEVRFDDGRMQRSARLDDYQVMDLKGIVAAICKEQGMPDPLAAASTKTTDA